MLYNYFLVTSEQAGVNIYTRVLRAPIGQTWMSKNAEQFCGRGVWKPDAESRDGSTYAVPGGFKFANVETACRAMLRLCQTHS